MPRLFEPLGIDPVWEEDNLGISFGGFGLNIKTEDIAVFGQMLLQKGEYNGRAAGTCSMDRGGNIQTD